MRSEARGAERGWIRYGFGYVKGSWQADIARRTGRRKGEEDLCEKAVTKVACDDAFAFEMEKYS